MLGEKIEKKRSKGKYFSKKMNPWIDHSFCKKCKAIDSKSVDSLSTEKEGPSLSL